MEKHRIYSVSVASVYPHYVAKAEKKGRTKAEVDEIICWLTGYGPQALDDQLAKNTSLENFFAQAPRMNPLPIVDYRGDLRRPRGRDPGYDYAGDPLPGQTDR